MLLILVGRGVPTRRVQAILHGSPDAQREGDVETQQHSKLVARGKYVHGFESMSTRRLRQVHVLNDVAQYTE